MTHRRRAGPRARAPDGPPTPGTSTSSGASTTSTRSTQLDTLDWTSDPWDDPRGRRVRRAAALADPLGQVGRLHRCSSSPSCSSSSPGWSAGGTSARSTRRASPAPRSSFTVAADDTLDSLSERLEAEGFIVDAGVFRWYVERHGGLEITPGYYELARQRPHGQRARPAAHAAGRDVHQGDVPRGVHRGARWPPASTGTWRR